MRLKIGSWIYEGRLSPVDDDATLSKIRGAYAQKYDLPDRPAGSDGEGPKLRYWTVVPRSEG